jgi:hypothetical protein
VRILFFVIFTFSSVVFSGEPTEKVLDQEFRSVLGCETIVDPEICYNSIRKHGDDFIITVDVNMFSHILYDHEKHFDTFVELTNEFYTMFNKRTAQFFAEPYEIEGLNYDLISKFEDKFVVVFRYHYKNKTATHIYDSNNTSYVDYVGIRAIDDLLNEHRSAMEVRGKLEYKPSLASYYSTISRPIYRESTREVLETAAK